MYYKVVLNGFPTVYFAHVYKTNHYYMTIPPLKSFLEISYVDKGDVIIQDEQGHTQTFPVPCILTNFANKPRILTCSDPLHYHETVGIQVNYEWHTVSPAEVVAFYNKPHPEMTSIISDYIPMDEFCLPVQKQIRKIIHNHSIQSESSFLKCSGLILELLAEITTVSLRNCLIKENRIASPGAALYCQKAMNYISAHLDQKLTVQEIASHLSISTGYLSSIFKDYTGCTLIEYINQRKLTRVKELMADNRLTLRQAGEQLGFFDENYLSRIFKKYIGLNARNCRQLASYNDNSEHT